MSVTKNITKILHVLPKLMYAAPTISSVCVAQASPPHPPTAKPQLSPFTSNLHPPVVWEVGLCFTDSDLTCVLFQHSEALASVVRSLTSLTQKDSPLDALEEVECSIVWSGGYKAWRVQTQCSNSYSVLKVYMYT